MGLFNETWILSTDFRKVVTYQIKWKSVRYERSCCLRTYRHDEANSRFSQFCKLIIKMHNLWTQFEETLKGEVPKIFPNTCARVGRGEIEGGREGERERERETESENCLIANSIGEILGSHRVTMKSGIGRRLVWQICPDLSKELFASIIRTYLYPRRQPF